MEKSCFNCRNVFVTTEGICTDTTGSVNNCKLTGEETSQEEDFYGCENYQEKLGLVQAIIKKLCGEQS
jgi:hypothetical protein